MTSDDSIFFCKECGGFIEYDTSIQLTSCPTKYRGECKEYGDVSYTLCSKVHGRNLREEK